MHQQCVRMLEISLKERPGWAGRELMEEETQAGVPGMAVAARGSLLPRPAPEAGAQGRPRRDSRWPGGGAP